MDNVIYLCSRTVTGKVFVACALVFLFGCGSKNQAADDTTSADAIKTPAERYLPFSYRQASLAVEIVLTALRVGGWTTGVPK